MSGSEQPRPTGRFEFEYQMTHEEWVDMVLNHRDTERLLARNRRTHLWWNIGLAVAMFFAVPLFVIRQPGLWPWLVSAVIVMIFQCPGIAMSLSRERFVKRFIKGLNKSVEKGDISRTLNETYLVTVDADAFASRSASQEVRLKMSGLTEVVATDHLYIFNYADTAVGLLARRVVEGSVGAGEFDAFLLELTAQHGARLSLKSRAPAVA